MTRVPKRPRILLALLCLLASVPLRPAGAQAPAPGEIARWERRAADVTITRDDWGIAHVRGKTDADAVFGMEYAQAEDDFNRVETNYLNSIGRLAEAEGEGRVWQDLRQKLFMDPDTLKALYRSSPESLRALMDAFADGLNFYLYRHPEVKPRVITRFEPWMALTFTEGSIGGDIESIALEELAAFYGGAVAPTEVALRTRDDGFPPEPTGSNGFAIAPKNALNGHALLWINPHTSFYFRSELQMTSDEGLNAYGAVTWGQFFVYQGFNPTAGWMHTSSGVDNIDEFLETVVRRKGKLYYRYGGKLLPLRSRTLEVPYRTADGGRAAKTFTVHYTQHGPVVRRSGERWVSVALMNSPVKALTQSYTRTKARNYEEFRRILELHTNSSNNTVFADAEGNIAYFHSNYIPRRDPSFDWTRPVEGSDPRTAYRGVLSVEETPGLLNPATGWLFNVNDWPWSAAGPDSPKRADFPAYVERGREETARGEHALRVLSGGKDWTMESLAAAAFDPYLPAFAELLPPLIRDYDALPAGDARRARLEKPVTLLRGWDYRWGVNSIPTSLAVFWGTELYRAVGEEARAAGLSPQRYAAERASPAARLGALDAAVQWLDRDFGRWQTPWGDINRFQRWSAEIDPHFDDSKPSIPVPFTSSLWGSLASFGARPYPNTKKWYGTSGNSFVAAVEFGERVRARAVTAGGESGHPGSPHFADEAVRYATGNLREVYFYPDQLEGHTERRYHPGQ